MDSPAHRVAPRRAAAAPAVPGPLAATGSVWRRGAGSWLRRRLDSRAKHALPIAALLLFGLVLLRTAWVSDDAMITMRTVDNFVRGFGLRWNVDERVQTYTHPLWMWLLALPYVATRSAHAALLLAGGTCSLAAAVLLAFRLARGVDRACLAVLLLILSKAFIDFSTSGLENPLSHLLLVLLLWRLRDRAASPGSWWREWLLFGLLLLTRSDLLLLAGPAVAAVAWRHRAQWNWRGPALGLSPMIVWSVFATWYYGSPIPNTALAKLNTGIAAGELLAQGMRYFLDSLRSDPLTLVTISLGAGWGLRRRRPLAPPLVAGIVLYLAYIVRIGGDFMSGRFLTPVFLVSVVLLVWDEAPWPRPARPVIFAIVIALGLAAPFPTIRSGRDYGLARRNLIDSSGIADERRFYFPWTGLLVPARRETASAFAQNVAARRARAKQDPLLLKGAIGFLGYGAGPRVHVVDYHALGDPLLSRFPVVARDSTNQVFLYRMAGVKNAPSWRIGHFRRQLPAGYAASVLSGENRIVDPEIRGLSEQIRKVTRGPLWSLDRLGAIVRLSLGRPRLSAAARARWRNDVLPWEEIVAERPAWPRGHAYWGEYETRRGRPGAAIPHLRQAVALDSADAFSWELLAEAHDDRSEDDEAARCARRALALDPQSPASLRVLARLEVQAKRFGEAERIYRRLLDLDPSSLVATRNLGAICNRTGRFGEAAALLERAQEMDPRSYSILYSLGVAQYEIGRFRQASRQFERSLEINSEYVPAWQFGGMARAKRGDTRRAGEMFEQVVRREPQNADAWLWLGDLAAKDGEDAKALDCWRAAARLGLEEARQRLRSRGLDG